MQPKKIQIILNTVILIIIEIIIVALKAYSIDMTRGGPLRGRGPDAQSGDLRQEPRHGRAHGAAGEGPPPPRVAPTRRRLWRTETGIVGPGPSGSTMETWSVWAHYLWFRGLSGVIRRSGKVSDHFQEVWAILDNFGNLVIWSCSGGSLKVDSGMFRQIYGLSRRVERSPEG